LPEAISTGPITISRWAFFFLRRLAALGAASCPLPNVLLFTDTEYSVPSVSKAVSPLPLFSLLSGLRWCSPYFLPPQPTISLRVSRLESSEPHRFDCTVLSLFVPLVRRYCQTGTLRRYVSFLCHFRGTRTGTNGPQSQQDAALPKPHRCPRNAPSTMTPTHTGVYQHFQPPQQPSASASPVPPCQALRAAPEPLGDDYLRRSRPSGLPAPMCRASSFHRGRRWRAGARHELAALPPHAAVLQPPSGGRGRDATGRRVVDMKSRRRRSTSPKEQGAGPTDVHYECSPWISKR